MLIEFRVENHRSIRQEQAFTLEAGRVAEGDASAVRPVGRLALLPVAAVYGANASGKSNLLDALWFMRSAVRNSAIGWAPTEGVPRQPFAWGDGPVAPSTFVVTVWLDGVKQEYGFAVDDREVTEEWLYAWPTGRRQVWFTRDRSRFKFGEHLPGPHEAIRKLTRENALFLSVAPHYTQAGDSPLTRLYTWFQGVRGLGMRRRPFLPPVYAESATSQTVLVSAEREARLQGSLPFWGPQIPVRQLAPSDIGPPPSAANHPFEILDLLRQADLGIEGLRVEPASEGGRRRRVFLRHRADREDAWLPLEAESEGTQQIFRHAPVLLAALRAGGVVLVDELESSLHPLLALHLVRLFNNPATNPQNAQLVFTTHDTHLLGSSHGDRPLRRDQVWLTEKDTLGQTVVYPLTDFKPRKAENLERGYLQGRYGAVPFLGDWPSPAAAEAPPSEVPDGEA